MVTEKEEIKYCTHCGSMNKKSAVVCEACEYSFGKKGSALRDYLIAHVKDQLQGKATDKFFELLTKFIRSHLYGVVMSVTIVATAVTYAVDFTPHIEKVTSKPAVQSSQTQDENVEEAEPINEQMEWMLGQTDYLYSSYENEAERLIWGDSYDPEISLPYNQLLADEVVADFPYSCVHDVKTHGTFKMVEDNENVRSSYSFGDKTVIIDGNKVTSDLAKQLYSDGYQVAERMHYVYGYNEHPGWKAKDIIPGDPKYAPDIQYAFNVVYVKIGDEWYIAEDRLIGR